MSDNSVYNCMGRVYSVTQIGLGLHKGSFKSKKKAIARARELAAEGGDWRVTRKSKPMGWMNAVQTLFEHQTRVVFRTDRCT